MHRPISNPGRTTIDAPAEQIRRRRYVRERAVRTAVRTARSVMRRFGCGMAGLRTGRPRSGPPVSEAAAWKIRGMKRTVFAGMYFSGFCFGLRLLPLLDRTGAASVRRKGPSMPCGPDPQDRSGIWGVSACISDCPSPLIRDRCPLRVSIRGSAEPESRRILRIRNPAFRRQFSGKRDF